LLPGSKSGTLATNITNHLIVISGVSYTKCVWPVITEAIPDNEVIERFVNIPFCLAFVHVMGSGSIQTEDGTSSAICRLVELVKLHVEAYL
jgi:hypothetical protein